MTPNPGLAKQFNRCLSNLDRILPRRSRRGDHGAQLLDQALQLEEIAPEAVQAVSFFLKRCEDFRTHQYWIDPEKENHDCAECWLPLAVVGKDWSLAVQSLLRLDLPKIFSKAKRIVLKPSGSEGPASLKLMLTQKVGHISEANYDRFKTLVKTRFASVETVFDPQSEEIEILAGKKIEIVLDSHDSPEHPLSSCMPWLDFLLQHDAVESLEFTYPRHPKQLVTLADVISGMLIMPTCPVKWRKKQAFPEDSVRHFIADALDIGPNVPFCLVVTAVEQQWMPLVDSTVRTAIAEEKIPHANGAIGTDEANAGFILRHLGRRLVFPPDFVLQKGTEYDEVLTILKLGEEDPEKNTPAQMLVCAPYNLTSHLTDRLNDVEYALEWIRYFSRIAKAACERLQAVPAMVDTPSSLRRVPGEFVVRVRTSLRDFSAFILSSISNSLDSVESIESALLQEKLTQQFRQSAVINLKAQEGNEGETASLHQIVRSLAGQGTDAKQTKALAALIYFIKVHDVIPDEDEHGYLDDALVLSEAIRSMPDLKDTPAGTWALKIHHESDRLLPRWLQERILGELSSLESAIQQIASANPKVKT